MLIGSILVEQGVENGLNTLHKFFKQELPVLRNFSLKSTLKIPSSSNIILSPFFLDI